MPGLRILPHDTPGQLVVRGLGVIIQRDGLAGYRLAVLMNLVFALLVVWICTGRGFFVREIRGAGFGAESVSRVTTQAVVLSSISVLIFDYLLTAVLL